jgi:ribosomal protein S18 acetylase RimI-like enzyme
MNGHTEDKIKNNNETLILNYLLKNEEFFINILEKFNNNYSKIPNSVSFYPFFINNKIDSLIAFTNEGYYYPHIKIEYIDEATRFLANNINKIFAIYGHLNIVNELIKKIKKPYRYKNEYYVMNLIKDNFIRNNINYKNFYCIPGNEKYFAKLKDMQYLYHKEEVYTDNSFYPYQAEMHSLKRLLKTKINFIVLTNDSNNLAVSKVNVNGESPNYFQIGGTYTRKEFRNRGLSKFCLNYFIDHIFTKTKKNGIILYVKIKNLPAIKLYKALGFTIQFESILCYY